MKRVMDALFFPLVNVIILNEIRYRGSACLRFCNNWIIYWILHVYFR